MTGTIRVLVCDDQLLVRTGLVTIIDAQPDLEVAGDHADAVGLGGLDLGGHGVEGRAPAHRLQAAADLGHGPIKALTQQAIAGVAALVAQPLLVDVLVDARQHAHHGRAAAVDADRRTQRVHDVDALRLLQLPRPRLEGVGLGGERTDRAQIDDVGR